MDADSRYSRQMLFKPIGDAGQARIGRSRVSLIGCGALGTAIANGLVRAGVGALTVCDRDVVELNNLQRQTLFDEDDVRGNLPKSVAAAEKLRRINSAVRVEPVVAQVHAGNVESLVAGADLVMDGTDNFETRFLVNDACVKAGVPWVYGGCVMSRGTVMGIVPGETPCLQCVFEAPPPPGVSPTADTAGILNAIPAIVAALACTEGLKILSGNRPALGEGILNIDIWSNEVRRFPARRDPACRCCARRAFTYLRAASGGAAASPFGRDAVQIVPAGGGRVDLAALAEALGRLGPVTATPHLLKAVVEGREVTVFPDGRAIVRGTTDPNVAQDAYNKYIGRS